MAGVLVFDTETTGLPSKRGADPSNLSAYNTARMVQIAWSVHTKAGALLSKECHMIKPSGFVITNSSFHGVTTEKAEAEGIPFLDAYEMLKRDLCLVDTIVAHNLDFDKRIVESEIFRAKLGSILSAKVGRCTMLMASEGGARWPKLIDLHETLFGEAPKTVLHRADNDTEVCARIYFGLVANARKKRPREASPTRDRYEAC
jgi:DNA polymerase III epsilon subunit-like protein